MYEHLATLERMIPSRQKPYVKGFYYRGYKKNLTKFENIAELHINVCYFWSPLLITRAKDGTLHLRKS